MRTTAEDFEKSPMRMSFIRRLPIRKRTMQLAEFEEWKARTIIQNDHIVFDDQFEVFVKNLQFEDAFTYIEFLPSKEPMWLLQDGKVIDFLCQKRVLKYQKDLGDGSLQIAFQSEASLEAYIEESIKAYRLEPLSFSDIEFTPLVLPEASQLRDLNRETSKIKWFSTELELQEVPEGGVLIDLSSMSRGQIYVNKRHLGRYLQPSAQEKYWIPASWLSLKNEIYLLDEAGHAPDAIEFTIQTHGPFERG